MKCKWCKCDAVRKQGRIWLCKKHYRFQQMRVNAKRNGKTVPDYATLELMHKSTNLICPTCCRKMNWLAGDGQATVLSLQHDRSGAMRFLCRSCNTRHASFSDDTFYEADPTCKVCPRCRDSKPLSCFCTDRLKRWKSKRTYCRECSTAMHREWSEKNRERLNANRRAYYHKRIASGNPIPR